MHSSVTFSAKISHQDSFCSKAQPEATRKRTQNPQKLGMPPPTQSPCPEMGGKISQQGEIWQVFFKSGHIIYLLVILTGHIKYLLIDYSLF